jgi:hypothetical protein
MAADEFEKLVSCARHPSYFCDMCSNLDPFSSSFSSVSTSLLLCFLSRSDPKDLTFFNKFMDASCASNCVPGKFMTKFSQILSSGTLHIQFVQINTLINSILNHTDIQNNNQ